MKKRLSAAVLFCSVLAVLLEGCASQETFTAVDEQLIRALRHAGRAEYDAALANGANVNARNEAGMTPLLMAAIADKPFCIRDLVRRGADVNTSDL